MYCNEPSDILMALETADAFDKREQNEKIMFGLHEIGNIEGQENLFIYQQHLERSLVLLGR